ncbi:hypothetical protein CR513_46922, partial [Mucuna pruriens]
MGHLSYNRVSSGKVSSSRCRGFRLNPRKLYVLRLRKRFNSFLRVFDSWKLSYGEAIQVLKKVVCRKGGFKRNNSTSLSWDCMKNVAIALPVNISSLVCIVSVLIFLLRVVANCGEDSKIWITT